MPSSTCVSMREFARQIGKSLTWVRNKCHSGELPLIDGKIPLQDGLKKCKAIIKESFRPKEALQKPLFPSRIEQNCSVRFFFTTSKNGVFCHQNSIILLC